MTIPSGRHKVTFMNMEIHIFAETDFDDGVRARIRLIEARVRGETAQYFLNVNVEEYCDHLVSEFMFDPLLINFGGVSADPYEQMIPAERFPSWGFFVEPGESYRKTVYRYHIPFSGDPDLLRCIPNPRVLNTITVEVTDGDISFDVIAFSDDPVAVKSEADRNINLIKEQFGHLSKQVEGFNDSLAATVRGLVEARKKEFSNQQEFAASLGVPLRKSVNVPETFAISAKRKRMIVERPKALAGPADPTIDDALYQQILQVIHDVGKTFERLPSTYAGKDEESLPRISILKMQWQPPANLQRQY